MSDPLYVEAPALEVTAEQERGLEVLLRAEPVKFSPLRRKLGV
jgi:hypothetical protein